MPTCYTEILLPTINWKMPWLQEEDATMQQEGVNPHTDHDTPSKPNSPGENREWNIKIVTNPS